MERRPDDEHDAVCDSDVRHQLIIAPPGTGKTHLAIRLAAKRVQELPLGASVLLLTFSNQARVQLEAEAARQITPELRKRIEVTNYHRFFWQAIRAFRRSLHLPMQIDIGSTKRREATLELIDPVAVRQIRGHTGLIESLAEHQFQSFQDERTPETALLTRLVGGIRSEFEAGRLVFDDLGALFWELIHKYPIIGEAYRRKYPIVIADEHQDASALQDAVVRELGSERITVLADPMQLIHGFRGARADRLDAHRHDCDEELSLSTPHRWHGKDDVARWLLAVRDRLSGQPCDEQLPNCVVLEGTNPQHGFNAMKPKIKFAVLRAFRNDAQRIAVLTRTNDQASQVRNYLCKEGLYPQQVGGPDFEDAREEIEQLPLLDDAQSMAIKALERIVELTPTLGLQVKTQVQQRLDARRVRLERSGIEAKIVLKGLAQIYQNGGAAYFEAVQSAVDGLSELGHHLPRKQAIATIRATASTLDPAGTSLGDALENYAARVLSASHSANRSGDGLYVMTVHQSKGKEFDGVIICDVSARFYPDNEESRQLLYVAVTRASTSWTIVAPEQGASPLLVHLGL
jgi:DNA helicase-2/ATP-dependent DNA helicase PcrA